MKTNNCIHLKDVSDLQVGELYFFFRNGVRFLCLCLSPSESKFGLVHGVLKEDDLPKFEIDKDPHVKIYTLGNDWELVTDPNSSIVEQQITGLVVDKDGLYIRFADGHPVNRRFASLMLGDKLEAILSPIYAKDAISSWSIKVNQDSDAGRLDRTVFNFLISDT